MRHLGVDYGRRRIGVAVSDATGLLARPWRAIAASTTPALSAAAVARLIGGGGDDDIREAAAIVVGLPRRLGGEDTDQTAAVRAFAEALARATGLPVYLQDERLTSREAEARLAEREPDWRKRKAQIDALSAAIILQDYLDAHRPVAADGAGG
jgi:putative Holliday junction resolvase